MGSTSKSMKRYAYVPIETYKGVDDEFLDQVLVKIIGEQRVRLMLENNAPALKSLKITKTKLIKGQVDLKPRLKEIGSLLKDNYALFNYCANLLNDVFLETIKEKIEKNDPKHGPLFDILIEVIEDSRENFYLVILFCRHYKNGLHKELIKAVVDYWEDKGHEDEILDETNRDKAFVELLEAKEELEIEQDKLIKERNELVREKLILLLEEDSSTVHDRFEDVAPLVDQMTTWMQKLNHRIKVASEENLRREVAYEENLKELEQLDGKLEAQRKELLEFQKQHIKQIASITTENNQLKKSNSQLQEKMEVQLKEHGKVTQMIGELRKEKESVIKEKDALERKISSYDKEKDKLENMLRADIKKEFDKQISNVLREKNDEIVTLQKGIDEQFSDYLALESSHGQLLNTMNLMETESKELHAALEEMQQSQKVRLIEKPTVYVEEIDEDDISLESLENLVNFNNQPY